MKFIGSTRSEQDLVDLKTGDFDIAVMMVSLLNSQLCIRKDIDPERAAFEYSCKEPPGTSYNEWVLDKSIASITCDGLPDSHIHIIVNC